MTSINSLFVILTIMFSSAYAVTTSASASDAIVIGSSTLTGQSVTVVVSGATKTVNAASITDAVFTAAVPLSIVTKGVTTVTTFNTIVTAKALADGVGNWDAAKIVLN